MKDIRPSPNVSPIGSVEALARQLGIEARNLIRLADDSQSHWRPGPDIEKSDGTVRKTNSATRELKSVHRSITENILRRSKYPHYLYGSLPKVLESDSRTHLDNAQLHAGQRLIVSTDIKNFFPSINSVAVRSIWQGFYPFSPEVAEVLTKLTVFNDQAAQGWACSSYLAQLAFYDSEHLVFERFSDRGIRYSRLTDDITLSTNRTLSSDELTGAVNTVLQMLGRKGARLHRGKTTICSAKWQQSVNKVNVGHGSLSLPSTYRKNARAKVHQLTSNPDSFDDIERAIQSAKGTEVGPVFRTRFS